jgi:hypothetical protein
LTLDLTKFSAQLDDLYAGMSTNYLHILVFLLNVYIHEIGIMALIHGAGHKRRATIAESSTSRYYHTCRLASRLASPKPVASGSRKGETFPGRLRHFN